MADTVIVWVKPDQKFGQDVGEWARRECSPVEARRLLYSGRALANWRWRLLAYEHPADVKGERFTIEAPADSLARKWLQEREGRTFATVRSLDVEKA